MLFAATRGLLPPPWSGRIACASVATDKTSRQYQRGLLAVAMAQKNFIKHHIFCSLLPVDTKLRLVYCNFQLILLQLICCRTETPNVNTHTIVRWTLAQMNQVLVRPFKLVSKVTEKEFQRLHLDPKSRLDGVPTWCAHFNPLLLLQLGHQHDALTAQLG
jgi:hypothetical protein